MNTTVDELLREEAVRFGLRHTCDDCVYFAGDQCAHEFPTTLHRLPIAEASLIAFCKEFEMA